MTRGLIGCKVLWMVANSSYLALAISDKQRKQAGDIASDIWGVSGVENQITIAGDRFDINIITGIPDSIYH